MKPILFNTEMVRAILDGRKTTTRRAIKGTALEWLTKDGFTPRFVANPENRLSPYLLGDILYVRETFVKADDGYHYRADTTPDSEQLRKAYGYKYHPSIHMPKVAARIFLRVIDVRAERLQEITEGGEKSEGMICTDFGMYQPKWKASVDGGKTFHPAKEAHYFGWNSGTAKHPEDCFPTPRGAFAHLWNSTVKKSDLNRFGWAANPWVWVISFERSERPSDTA